MKTHQSVADTLRKALEAEGMTQTRLRQLAGLSPRTLQLVLSGKHDFKLSTLFSLADRLGLEMVLVPKAAAASLHAGHLEQPTPPVVQSRSQAALERLQAEGGSDAS